MKTEQYPRAFEEQAIRAINERFAAPAPVVRLAHLVAEQEASSRAAHGELSDEGRALQKKFERDGVVLGEHISAATKALKDRWVPRDGALPALRDRLHFFGPDSAGKGGPWVYKLAWGNIEGGTGGAGIGVQTILQDGTFSASHYTHGSNHLAAYAGIGVSMVPSLDVCTLSIRPLVEWNGFDILSSEVFDRNLKPSGWGVAGARIGIQVQSWDLAGGTFRNEPALWGAPVWERSELNPSGARNYNDTVDARSLQLDVLATKDRQYVIWVSCKAFVITQAPFGLDIRASASITCRMPYLAVEEVAF
jgi:hypothetical protein